MSGREAPVAPVDEHADVLETERLAEVTQLLERRCWLVAGRDDAMIEAVYRRAPQVREVMARAGRGLVVSRDLVRVRKPAPHPKDVSVPQEAAPEGTWFFLLLAGMTGLPRPVGLGDLVSAARSAASEAGIPVTGSAAELRLMLQALAMLRDRGLITEVQGRVEMVLHDEKPAVLLDLRHEWLRHVIANGPPLEEDGQWQIDPAQSPERWLAALERPRDPGTRVCQLLIDSAVVHTVDLSEDEASWMSHRLGSEGAAVAAAYGLGLERRAEGGAFVMPAERVTRDEQLGPGAFPGRSGGTVAHACLRLRDVLLEDGTSTANAPGPRWTGMAFTDVVAALARLAAEPEQSWWAGELRGNTHLLAQRIRGVLEPLNLLRVTCAYEDVWWLSPAAARWDGTSSSLACTTTPTPVM